MTQANHYTHTSDGILPHAEARRCDVGAFRDVNYAANRAELCGFDAIIAAHDK